MCSGEHILPQGGVKEAGMKGGDKIKQEYKQTITTGFDASTKAETHVPQAQVVDLPDSDGAAKSK